MMYLPTQSAWPRARGAQELCLSALRVREKKPLRAGLPGGWRRHKVSVCGPEDVASASGDFGEDPSCFTPALGCDLASGNPIYKTCHGGFVEKAPEMFCVLPESPHPGCRGGVRIPSVLGDAPDLCPLLGAHAGVQPNPRASPKSGVHLTSERGGHPTPISAPQEDPAGASPQGPGID